MQTQHTERYGAKRPDPMHQAAAELRNRGCVDVPESGLQVMISSEEPKVPPHKAGIIPRATAGSIRLFSPENGNILELNAHSVRIWHWKTGTFGQAKTQTIEAFLEELLINRKTSP